MSTRLLAAISLAALAWASAASAAEMPVAEQNALVKARCAVCHTDKARNGGLSLEGFDAAQAPPSLAAMLLSKITNGVALDTVRAMTTDEAAAKVVLQRSMGGAIFAAGPPIPPIPALTALTEALAARTAAADRWAVVTTRTGTSSVTVASVLRELPPERKNGVAPAYRLSVSCDRATRAGELRLSWAPSPATGTLLVSADGAAPSSHVVEGLESNGNGSSGSAPPSSVVIAATAQPSGTRPTLPARSLRVSGLFPGEAPEFSFADLSAAARTSLGACFSSGATR